MANKRMFNLKIVDSDAFLDMPLSAQCLYFHLNMRADDDGFIGNPKRIQRLIGASEDDLKLLIAKQFLLVFEDGVIVIKHWRLHNTIRKDRYTQTVYTDELKRLGIKENKAYTFDLSNGNALEAKSLQNGKKLATKWQPTVNTDIGLDIDKDIDKGLDKDAPLQCNHIVTPGDGHSQKSIDGHLEGHKEDNVQKKKKHRHGQYNNVLLTDSEFESLKSEYSNYNELITYLDEYIEMKGYKAKSHYLCIKKWVVNAVNEKKNKPNNKPIERNRAF